jgi:hypothetical protein
VRKLRLGHWNRVCACVIGPAGRLETVPVGLHRHARRIRIPPTEVAAVDPEELIIQLVLVAQVAASADTPRTACVRLQLISIAYVGLARALWLLRCVHGAPLND